MESEDWQDAKLSVVEMVGQILAITLRMDAKIDLLAIELSERRAKEKGTSPGDEMRIIDEAVKEKVARTAKRNVELLNSLKNQE